MDGVHARIVVPTHEDNLGMSCKRTTAVKNRMGCIVRFLPAESEFHYRGTDADYLRHPPLEYWVDRAVLRIQIHQELKLRLG